MYDRKIAEPIEYHLSMLANVACMKSYLQAVLRTVEPGHVVLDTGSGTGILTYFACTAGAKCVCAMEQDPVVVLARTICVHNGIQNQASQIYASVQDGVDAFLAEHSGQLELS